MPTGCLGRAGIGRSPSTRSRKKARTRARLAELAECNARRSQPCILHSGSENRSAFAPDPRGPDGHTYCSRGRMLDLIFIGVTVGFFALSIAYTRGCDRL